MHKVSEQKQNVNYRFILKKTIFIVLKLDKALVVKLVDTKDLKNLSASKETLKVELRKFGGGLTANTEPSQ